MNERMIKRTAMRRGRASRPTSPMPSRSSVPDLAGYITGVELNVSGGIELFTF